MFTTPIYDEQQLLIRLSSDDREAFATLYQRYHSVVKHFVIRFVKSRELSDDLTQEVFIKIWEHRRRLGEVQSFKAYLLTVSQNHVFSFLKNAAKNEKETGEIVRTYAKLRNHTEEKLLSKEYWQHVEKVLRSLPDQTRNVFGLCRQQDKSYEEAAQILGISHHAVKKHMMRANRVFRSSFKNLLDISVKLFALAFFLR